MILGNELMSSVKNYIRNEGMQEAQVKVVNMMKEEARMSSKNAGRDNDFSGVASFLGSTPYTKQLSVPASIQLQMLHNVQER